MESTEQGSHLKQGDHGAMNYGTVSAHHGGQAAKPKHASGGGWGRFARLVALAVFFIVGALGVSSVLTSPRSSSAKQHAGAVAPRVHAHAALAAGAGAHGGAAQGVEGGDKVEEGGGGTSLAPYSVFLLISVILFLSIGFEKLKETISEVVREAGKEQCRDPEVFDPITDAFFSELATLGFIGAIAFTLTYAR